MNKTPAIAQSENLPPWQWKREKAPKNTNPGPALQPSINTTDPYPCAEDGKDTLKIEVACVQNGPLSQTPASMGNPVIPLTATPVLEDGKEPSNVASTCVENRNAISVPHSAHANVIREDIGLVLENVKMIKGLT